VTGAVYTFGSVGVIRQIDGSAGGAVGDVAGNVWITLGNAPATVTAALGADTIQASAGALTVDATNDAHPLVVDAGTGVLQVRPGAGGSVRVVGSTGQIAVWANGAYTTWVGSWGDTVVLDHDAGGNVRLTDLTTGAVYAFTAGGIVHEIDGSGGGAISDLPGNDWITLGGLPATVTAALGSDAIQAGSGALTVDATYDTQSVVINAGTGALRVKTGSGPVWVVGAQGQFAVANSAGVYFTWTGPWGDTVALDHDANGLVRLTDQNTGQVYTVGSAGVITGTGAVSSAAMQRNALLAGEGGSALYNTLAQQLAATLPATGQVVSIGPGQAVPTGANVVAALTIPANGGSGLTVPAGVTFVINALNGNTLYGNGAANQLIVSRTSFTYQANGGSGAVLADDAAAGGRAGNDHVVLARGGGGGFAIATGSGDDTIEASSGNDTVSAGAGSNMIYLGTGTGLVYAAGTDTVISGSGATTVDATAAPSSLVFGGPGTLDFIGGWGATTVVAGTGPASLAGGGGSAVFWGSANGRTTIQSGSGNSTLVGGGGGNLIRAGGGHDELLVAGFGGSTILGGGATGNNFYWGSVGADFLAGDAGADTIIGGPGYDTVQAGSGSGLIFGGNDGDLFLAGAGNPNTVIVAGGGAPSTYTFVNGAAGGTETIWGFRPGTDHVSLQGYAANALDTAFGASFRIGLSTGITLSDGTTIIFGNCTGLTAQQIA
jgi:hypothetical protein